MPEVEPVETELCQLAYKYGTDKCPRIRHHYTPWYYGQFKGIRADIRKVVEMGIGVLPSPDSPYYQPQYRPGASLRMWRDFFPQAQVYGGDYERSVLFEEERIQTRFCNEKSNRHVRAFLEWVGPGIDLFVDDARHMVSYQTRLARWVFEYAQGDPFLYVIEDVRPDQWREIEEILGEFETHYIPGTREDPYGLVTVRRLL